MTATLPEPTRARAGGPRQGAAAARRYREARRRAVRQRLVRETRRGVLSAGLVAAAWAVGIGLLVCAALTVLGWTVGGHGSATFDVALRAGGLVFVASHLTPVSLPAGTVSLLPLGLLALPLLLTYRAGRWAVRSSDCRSLSSAAGLSAIAAGGYAAAVAVVAGVSDIDGVHASAALALPIAFLVSFLGFGAGAVRGARLHRQLLAQVPGPLRTGTVAAAATLAALGFVSGATLTVVLATRLPAVADLAAQLAPGVSDGAALLLLGLLYLPTTLVWSLAYVAGPGIALGGAVLSPFGTGGGLAPAFPLLAAAPATPPPLAGALLLLPVLAGAIGGVVVARRSGSRRILLRDVLVTAGLTGLAGGVLALLASGALGDGRLSHVGPSALLVGLALAALVLAGAAPVALLHSVLTGHVPRLELGRRGADAWAAVRARLYHDGSR